MIVKLFKAYGDYFAMDATIKTSFHEMSAMARPYNDVDSQRRQHLYSFHQIN